MVINVGNLSREQSEELIKELLGKYRNHEEPDNSLISLYIREFERRELIKNRTKKLNLIWRNQII